MTAPTVTVLTAVRNGARYLVETVASIQRQSFTDWEYVIVDDASTDGTAELVEALSCQDPRIRLIRRNVCGGPFVAANEGLREARGKYVVRTDGDDVSLPARIERQLEFLRRTPSARACATFCQALDATGPIPDYYHRAPLTSGTLKWYLCLRCPLVHSSACVERRALTEIGGYRELPLAQDYRLWCDLARPGWLAVLPEALVYFRRHPARVSELRAGEQRRLAVDILRDHLQVLTGDVWPQADLEALYAVGHAQSLPIELGLGALRRWDALWQADPDLTSEERRELAKLSAFRRRRFLRNNLRQQPLHVIRNCGQFLFARPSWS